MSLNRTLVCGAGLILLCAVLVSCNRATVTGVVVDVQGRSLPGVAVHARGGDAEALTDALGQYALKTPPGIRGLDFLKNGYTSGHLDIDVNAARTFTANRVSLWCLPQTAGVFLFEDNHYRRSTPIEPERFGLKDKSVFGTGRPSNIETTPLPQPLLICYKMPPYDVYMSRLHPVQAMSSQAGKGQQEAWIQEAPIRVELLPIDEPERLLLQVRTAEALQPGVYAVHWGALDGHTSTDPRMFLFRVIDPAHPDEAEKLPEKPPEKPQQPEPPKAKPKPKPPESAPAPTSEPAIDTEAADAEAAAPVQ